MEETRICVNHLLMISSLFSQSWWTYWKLWLHRVQGVPDDVSEISPHSAAEYQTEGRPL